jgi:multiple sugar transport system permease protein
MALARRNLGRLRRQMIGAAPGTVAARGLMLRGRDRIVLALMVLPALVWLAFAQGYPLFYSLWMSFVQWSLASSPDPQGFAGLNNFRSVLNDPVFISSLRLSALFVLSVPAELMIGFLIATLTVGEQFRMRMIRTLLLIPMVVAPIAAGTMWRLVLSPTGLANLLLGALHLPAVNWLGTQNSAVWSVLMADVWEWVPFSMIVYVAALGGVSDEIISSARVDGASALQVVRRLLIPLTMPATLLILIFRLVDAFLTIDIVFSLTYGGPGFATTSTTLYIYNHGLKYFDLSQAAASSWMILLACFLMAGILLRLKSRAEKAVSG